MKMKKRLFGILLMLTLMAALMAGMGAAAHAVGPYYYEVWVGGTQVTSTNKDNILGDGKVSYDPNNKTLTLNGAAITGGYTFDVQRNGIAAIYAEGDLTIDVTADSTVNGPDNGSGISCGVYIDGSLTVTVTGALTAEGGETRYGSSYGVHSYGSLTVTGTGALTAVGGETRDGNSCGVYAGGTVTVNGTLTAEGGETLFGIASSYGVYAEAGNVTVAEGGTLTAESGPATYGNSYGVYTETGNVTVAEGGKLTAESGPAKYSYSCSSGVYADGNVTVNGTLTATGGETSNGHSSGVYTNSGAVTVTGALTAAGNTQAIRGSVKNAIPGTGWTDAAGTEGWAHIAVSEEGQTLEYKKVQFPAIYPVWVGGTQVTGLNMADVMGDGKVRFTPATDTTPATLTLSGAAITGGYTFGINGAAIYAEDDLTINVTADSTVTCPNGSGDRYGVYSGGSLTVTGSRTLTAAGGNAISNSYGVYADSGAVTVNGKLTAEGGEAAKGYSYGVRADGVTVEEGATLTATGGTATNGTSYGVRADKGAVTVNGTLTAAGGAANGYSYGVWAYGAVTVNGKLTAAGGATNGYSCGVLAWYGAVTVNGTLDAAGNTQAIYGSVTNAVAGTGWTDTAGTTGMANIAVSAAGQSLDYKKVQFPVPPYGTPDFTLPAAIMTIEENAFEGAAMTVVYIPDTCTAIGAGAFKDCAGLEQIRVPANCTISDGAFTGCGTVYIFAPAGSPAESYCSENENCVFIAE